MAEPEQSEQHQAAPEQQAAGWTIPNPFELTYNAAQAAVDYVYDDIATDIVWPKLKKLYGLASRPDELLPLAQMALAARRAKQLPKDPNLAFCYDMLNKVSRSFAVVIQQLPPQLQDPVCVFYLVLRALDTVEDDMAIPDDVKLPILLSFHEKNYDRTWSMDCGSDNYQRLMQNYPRVTEAFLGLEEQYQKVIADICRRMGAGMAEFIVKEVATVAEYEKYCFYVAGLVGIGLSNLWAASGIEDPAEFAGEEVLSNHMGLFLQKTNIIRDYLEDILEEPAPRMFWPREIWGNYADELAAFKEPANAPQAVSCLNHMVTDALKHVPHCLRYLERVRDWHIFRFCAIPQVMAAGTLGLCYGNVEVFRGVVKMRRGLTCKYMAELASMRDVYEAFDGWAAVIDGKCRRVLLGQNERNLAVAKQTAREVANIRRLCADGLAGCPPRRRSGTKTVLMWYFNALAVLLLAYLVMLFFGINPFLSPGEEEPQTELLE